MRDYHVATTAKAREGVRISPQGRRPRWRTRLVIEPVEANIVRMIFPWRGEDRPPRTTRLVGVVTGVGTSTDHLGRGVRRGQPPHTAGHRTAGHRARGERIG